MPNWVSNNLTITGPESEVQAVKNRLAAPYERIFQKIGKEGSETRTATVDQTFSFWNIVRPEGEDRVKYEESLEAPGAAPFWYDWNVNNWGTKWDTDAELTEHAADHLQYVFSTAWSPPVEALTTLGKNFPTVHIELEWEEEQGFGGTFVLTEGAVNVTDEYDIPDSHAVMMERKEYCYCESAGEKFFTDCPIEEVDPEFLIPNDEIIVESMV